MRAAYYALVLDETTPTLSRARLLNMLLASVSSLRQYNQRLPVYVVSFSSALSKDVQRVLSDLGVTVVDGGSYLDAVARLHPEGAKELAQWPALTRWLALEPLRQAGQGDLLYLDCDTYFFADVDRLFDTYREGDWYAREEPYSRASPWGYKADYLDEDLLAQVAAQEGRAKHGPYNSGVALMNHGTGERLSRKLDDFLDVVWRFSLWMLQNPIEKEAPAIRALRAQSSQQWLNHPRALQYPSSNRWPIEQVALGLTLGRLEGLKALHFTAEEVLQGNEFEFVDVHSPDWVVVHYYSIVFDRFERFLAEGKHRLVDAHLAHFGLQVP